ncbi:AraC family transcriptional regulator [Shewanella pealeana]|uniref:Transcriptional regulator, AraC family n=1 Tax=Shewanella pealeana (strain ATCC 700345 / ANG-SQ1) TaxID=398579 RepID=A8H6A2_SHEPA|nr:helix-turn-helix transcriptional regulator [Shewanella pealeana]ABV88089.1 transcriptional regulator, AraC family [Shewanella pealeana ATCC 700345]
MVSLENISITEHNDSDSSESKIDVVKLEQIYTHQNQYFDNPFQPQFANYFSFIYIEKGQGEHLVDGVLHPYQSGDVIFINQGQHHAFDAADSPQGKMVIITPTFFSECSANIRYSYFIPFHLSLSCASVLRLDPCLSQNCHSMINLISDAIAQQRSDSIEVKLLFSALVLKLAQLRSSSSQRNNADGEHRRRFSEFLGLVEQKFHLEREAKSYADQMHLSYKALNQLCKCCSGRTAKQIIDFRLNLEILRKLRMQGDCVQSIAFELGFDDITNFVRYFKRLNGQTPSCYRSAYNAVM